MAGIVPSQVTEPDQYDDDEVYSVDITEEESDSHDPDFVGNVAAATEIVEESKNPYGVTDE